MEQGAATGGGTMQRASDFAQLQKEYRLMEMNRKVSRALHKDAPRGCLALCATNHRGCCCVHLLLVQAFAEESHQVLRKQQGSLEKLRADNEALKTELAMEMRSHARPSNLAVQRKEALKLRDEIEEYSELVAAEKRTMKVTTEQITLMKQKIQHTRKSMGGVNAARENQAMIQKQIRILENRLDKALVKFNESLAHNKKLRDAIDDLRRERVVFDSIYKKVDKVRVVPCVKTRAVLPAAGIPCGSALSRARKPTLFF